MRPKAWNLLLPVFVAAVLSVPAPAFSFCWEVRAGALLSVPLLRGGLFSGDIP